MKPEARFYQASSSEMYGKVHEVPQTETTPFHPRSPYGVAKVYGYFITLNYRESFGMHASNGILFNHESPRRGLEFVTRKITDGVAASSSASSTSCGWATSTPSATGASPATTSRRCGACCSRTSPATTCSPPARRTPCASSARSPSLDVGLDWEKYVVVDQRFVRPAEVELLLGDPDKAKRELGWEPKVYVCRARRDDGRRRHGALSR